MPEKRRTPRNSCHRARVRSSGLTGSTRQSRMPGLAIGNGSTVPGRVGQQDRRCLGPLLGKHFQASVAVLGRAGHFEDDSEQVAMGGDIEGSPQVEAVRAVTAQASSRLRQAGHNRSCSSVTISSVRSYAMIQPLPSGSRRSSQQQACQGSMGVSLLVCVEIGCSRCRVYAWSIHQPRISLTTLALRRKVVAVDVPPSARQAQPAVEHEKTAGSEASRCGRIGNSALQC